MKCKECGNRLTIIESISMLYYFQLRWNKQEKYIKLDMPLCFKCFENKPAFTFDRGVKS